MSFTIPARYGSPFLLRSFLPGLVSSLLIFYALPPAVPWLGTFWRCLSFEQKLVLLAASSLIIGAVITTLDYRIYTFYEGRFGWPEVVKSALTKRLSKKVALLQDRDREILDEIKKLKESGGSSQSELERVTTLENERKEIWFNLRMFPASVGKPGSPEIRQARLPTMLGNILAESESYPLLRYGMDPVFYWYRLVQIVPRERMQALDRLKATSDFLVYTSAVLVLYAPIHLISYLVGKLYCLSLLGFVGALLISGVLYRISLSSLRQYCESTKGVYDVYRHELRRSLLHPVTTEGVEKETDFWRNVWLYLQYGQTWRKEKELRNVC